MTLSTEIRSTEKTLEDYHRELLAQIKYDHEIITSAIQTNGGDIGNLKKFSIELESILKNQAQSVTSNAIASTDAHFKNFAGNYTEALRQCVATLRVVTEAVQTQQKQLDTVTFIASRNSVAISDLSEYLKTSQDATDKRLEVIEKALIVILQQADKKPVK